MKERVVPFLNKPGFFGKAGFVYIFAPFFYSPDKPSLFSTTINPFYHPGDWFKSAERAALSII
jgi:hypothetical protein